MTRRIVRASRPKPKPGKPYDGFPLTAHASGKWCKKVAGVVYYFGQWDDPDRALNEWLDRRDGIYAGRDHERFEDDGTHEAGDDVAALCNEFLATKLQQKADGDLTQPTYVKYEKSSDRFVEFFGKRRKLASIRTPDFRRYRASWPNTWNAWSVNNEIARCKAILNFAFETGMVDRPFQTGPNLKRVSRKKQRIERAAKPKKLFSASEIHRLVDAADVQIKAMIHLGVNCGFGGADCGRLTISSIDFENSWLEGPRPKTGIMRAAWLWPETVQAIRAAIDSRYDNAPDSLADHVFITKRRQAWYRGTGNDNPVGAAFAKLRKKVLEDPVAAELVKSGLTEKDAAKQAATRWTGVSFYALRHVCETIAGGSKDQVATDYVMGHADPSMAADYREEIDRQRIIDVCGHVRDWWLEGKS